MFVVFCLFACLSRVLANVFKPIGWLPGMCDVHAKAKIKPTPELMCALISLAQTHTHTHSHKGQKDTRIYTHTYMVARMQVPLCVLHFVF